MDSWKSNRQSAAKTLHKPVKGFEYRYSLSSDGNVYDKYKHRNLPVKAGKVTLIGINGKAYTTALLKLFTDNITDFSEYEEVKGHEGYIINQLGSLYNTKSKRFISTTVKNGCIRYNVDWQRRHMHQVLADQFLPNPNNYEAIDHIDGNKLNNSLTNLEWVSIAENNKRAIDNGLSRIVKSAVTFIKDSNSFTLIGLENASSIFGIKKSCLCTLIKRYGNKDIAVPTGSLKGYKIEVTKCKCKVQRLSERSRVK